MGLIDRIKKLVGEIRLELSRVTWPRKEELWGSTLIVILVSTFLAIIIGAMDIIFSHMIKGIIK
ncbi:MAG TPA: preprotein translocase subunit SecE [bacterium (Candidatus Stahlbacteria)]|nr:preprotein translocase subunit SecE [Candidatus Stahlbacteria bacterium]